MSQNPDKKPTGRVNYAWVLGGGYLVWTAYKLIVTMVRGEAGAPLLSVAAIIVFGGVGGWLLWREWKAYQWGKAHMDDPSTWSLEEDEEELSAPPKKNASGYRSIGRAEADEGDGYDEDEEFFETEDLLDQLDMEEERE